MSTTTLRLPAPLKKRLDRLARDGQQTAHSLMLEAIERAVAEREEAQALERLASARWASLVKTGQVVEADAMKGFVRSVARGEPVSRPRGRKLQ